VRHPRREVMLFPQYSPEFSRYEDIWAWEKSKGLANLCALDDKDLVHHVRASLRRMQRREEPPLACAAGSEFRGAPYLVNMEEVGQHPRRLALQVKAFSHEPNSGIGQLLSIVNLTRRDRLPAASAYLG